MRRIRVTILLVMCVLLGIGVVAFWPGEREPEYNGKKLSEWLEICRLHPSPDPQALQAENAVRSIGTNALPWLVKWMNYDRPDWKQKMLVSKYSRYAPEFVMYRVVRPIILSQNARIGFGLLGKAASPAGPGLARIIDNWPRTSWAEAVIALRGLGPEAFPSLYSFVTNRAKPLEIRRAAMASIGNLDFPNANEEWVVRAIVPYLAEAKMAEQTARTLGEISTAPSISVPALLGAAESEDPEVRIWAIISLGRFHNQAEQAIPTLLYALDDSDSRVRQEVTNALSRIVPDMFVTNRVKGF